MILASFDAALILILLGSELGIGFESIQWLHSDFFIKDLEVKRTKLQMRKVKSILVVGFLVIVNSSFAQEFVKNTFRPISKAASKAEKLENWTKVDSIFIYGGGSLLNSVSGNGSEANPPSGSLGFNFLTSRISLNALFSYNAKSQFRMDSLSTLGSALMNPNTSGQSLSAVVVAQFVKYFGFSGQLIVAPQSWQLDSLAPKSATPFITRLGFYIRPFQFPPGNNEVNFAIDAHFTHRDILGNFGNEIHDIGGEKIKPRGYNGFDIGGNIYLNSVRLIARFSFNNGGDPILPNLHGTQVTLGVDVAGALFRVL